MAGLRDTGLAPAFTGRHAARACAMECRGAVMTGLLLKGMIPMPVLMITPWPLPDISAFVALGMPLPPNWYVPIVAVIFWIVVMTAVALWRFSREEF